MNYKLYTDKNENFECEVSVKNASLKDSIARLIIESDNLNLVFKGEIKGDKCVVPIKRLKGLLDESSHGKIHLEIIVEDTYFRPWESNFIVEEHTSVKVKVNENKVSSNKPIINVKVPVIKTVIKKNKPKSKNQNLSVPISEISLICERFKIKKSNYTNRKNDLIQILKTYFQYNPEYKNHLTEIVSNVGVFLK